jgi:ABC-2 type transport system permease protein
VSTANALSATALTGTRTAHAVPGVIGALARVLIVEVGKLKRTLAAWMVVVAPLLVLVFTAVTRLANAPEVTSDDAWPALFGNVLGIWGILMLPMFVALEAALLGSLEHGEQHWKRLYALPLPRWTFYAAKLLVCLGLVGLSSLVLAAGAIGTGLALRALQPGTGLDGAPSWGLMLAHASLVYVTAWLMLAIQTWVSLRWSSVVVALGVGVAGTVAGVMLASGAGMTRGALVAQLFPWSLPTNVLMRPAPRLDIALPWAIAGSLAVAALGCRDVTRRDVS